MNTPQQMSQEIIAPIRMGAVDITHLSPSPEGYTLNLTGVGKTAGSAALMGEFSGPLPKEQQMAMREAVWGEMRFSKFPTLARIARSRLD